MLNPFHPVPRSFHTQTLGLLGMLCGVVVVIGCDESGDRTLSDALSSSTAIADHGIKFKDVAAEWGITFKHTAPSASDFDLPAIMGSGCAIFDYDQDGLLDLYFVNLGSDNDRATNKLFKQTKEGLVEVVTSGAENSSGIGMGVAAGDLNNDGIPDLYVSNLREDCLLLGNGKGFRDVTSESGISNPRWGASVSLIDFDRDGWLDIFVTNYVDYVSKSCKQLSGNNPDFCGPHRFDATPDVLFRNITGELDDTSVPKFEDVSAIAGLSEHKGAGLGVVCADFTSDGFPDIYVANDQTANFFWINQQDGTFEEKAISRGCAYDMLGNAQASMGCAVGFFNGDRSPDLLLTHLTGEPNTLYVSDGRGFFSDQSRSAQLANPSMALTGFGTAFADFDLDGFPDLVTANGAVKRPEGWKQSKRVDFWQPYRQPHQLLLGRSEAKFAVANKIPGLDGSDEVSRGLAVGDLNSDGRPDLVICNTDSKPEVLLNESSTNGRHWVALECRLPHLNSRLAIGACVRVVSANNIWQAIVQPATSYLSSNSPSIHIGLGETSQVDKVEVTWPDGTREEFESIDIDAKNVLLAGKGTTQAGLPREYSGKPSGGTPAIKTGLPRENSKTTGGQADD